MQLERGKTEGKCQNTKGEMTKKAQKKKNKKTKNMWKNVYKEGRGGITNKACGQKLTLSFSMYI